MLSYTGHPLVDVGVATITAFAGKKEPSSLTLADLDKIADYMERNYIVDPLKSFLTVAFPNSGFTQPAFEKEPEKRKVYAQRVLRAYRPETPTLKDLCVFTGKPAVAVSFDVKGNLPEGRVFRQHVPLLTGEGCINFHPYGDAGLTVSGEALLAIQALPLGCAKVGGRLLAVHADDPDLSYRFARHFLEQNRKAIQTAQLAKEKKLPEPEHRVATLLIETFLRVQEEQHQAADENRAVSVTAYHFTNIGQTPKVDLYHLPLEIGDFLIAAMSARHKQAWDGVRARGGKLSEASAQKSQRTARKHRRDITSFTRISSGYQRKLLVSFDVISCEHLSGSQILMIPDQLIPSRPRAISSLGI